MKIAQMLNRFRKDESGAVTVDWVVLTAAIVGLGIAVLTSVGNSTKSLADTISGELGSMSVMSY